MDRKIHNPWTWQDELGFVQANEVAAATRTVYCSGQTAVDDDGRPTGGDMGAQMEKALDNLETVLAQAGLTLADVMRMNAYVTDVQAYFEHMGPFNKRLAAAECRFAGSLVQVSGLALPELVIELEATAVA